MADNKTKPTSVSVDDFLMTVSEQRQKEAQQLIDIMQKISGEKPVMWGPSIIGFGLQHYKSEAGREGDMPILGFSPRKSGLTIYFYESFDRYGKELAQLGKHKISQSCLYINKLDNIDLTILRTMLQSSYDIATQPKTAASSVDAYVASVPPQARPLFDELRILVTAETTNMHEVISYGVIGYKHDVTKRASIFISGWKDHLAIYPIPKTDVLKSQLEPYIKGRGTLWFTLDAPLPKQLIKDIVRTLINN